MEENESTVYYLSRLTERMVIILRNINDGAFISDNDLEILEKMHDLRMDGFAEWLVKEKPRQIIVQQGMLF